MIGTRCEFQTQIHEYTQKAKTHIVYKKSMKCQFARLGNIKFLYYFCISSLLKQNFIRNLAINHQIV